MTNKYVWAVTVDNQVVAFATSRQEARSVRNTLRTQGHTPTLRRAPMTAFTPYLR